MYRKNRGFTLMELVITIVLVSILMAIALPSYQNSVRKSRRAYAMAALMQAAAWQEQWYNRNNSYSANADPFGDNAAYPSEKGLYMVSATVTAASVTAVDGSGCATDGQCVLLTATPVNGQAQEGDECGSFRMTGTGYKGFTGAGGSQQQCW